MGIEEMLNAMWSKENNVHLLKTQYTDIWHCTFKHDSQRTRIEITETADTAFEAVTKTYNYFMSIGTVAKQILPAMLVHHEPTEEVPFQHEGVHHRN